ncbi:MAG TPA: sigma-70 family RNA polymerase sigma factor [Terriglobales bacterium]|nr:sigma-70 family RNA polymerase sigma factor [Terriglobales bacterium]
MSSQPHSSSRLLARLGPLARELYANSGGEKYSISEVELLEIIEKVTRKYLREDASDAEVGSFCRSLHVEELVLARACAAGNERAWRDFMLRYREKLHEAALRITRDDAGARELAGSLYADLYGTSSRDGIRVAKLAYYHGRGSLEGWLRTVLAQHHVNQYRRGRNTVSLEEQTEAGKQFAAVDSEPERAIEPRLNDAITEAIRAVQAEDRCMLSYYFLDNLTLARIASVLGVHESTVSRRLEKVVKTLRKDIVFRLTRKGMSRRQAEEALETDVREITADLRAELAQDSPPAAFPNKRVIRAGEGQE